MKAVLFALFVGLAMRAHAQDVFVQWSTALPQDFQPVKDWAALPKLPDPSGRNFKVSTEYGWVAAIKIDGRIICCCDHYAVVTSKENVASYCWRDDHWYARGAEVCIYRPALNCQYFGTWYKTNSWERLPARPWGDFIFPDEKYIRHGITIDNDLWREHRIFWEHK